MSDDPVREAIAKRLSELDGFGADCSLDAEQVARAVFKALIPRIHELFLDHEDVTYLQIRGLLSELLCDGL